MVSPSGSSACSDGPWRDGARTLVPSAGRPGRVPRDPAREERGARTELAERAPGRHRRDRRPGARDRRGACRPLRARRDAAARPALRRRPADDAQPGRRRGPRAGDLPQGVRRVRHVPRGHQPQGLALPDPHQHLHQRLPPQAAAAAAVAHGGDLRLADRPGERAHLAGAAVGRGRGARPAPGRRRQGRAAAAARRLPDGGLPRRRRGLRVQGDRRHHGHAHRHGDVAAAPRPPSAARPAHRHRPRARLHPRQRAVNGDVRGEHSEAAS